jgi:hypothetical protein
MCPVILPQVSEYLYAPILVTLVHVPVPGTDCGRITGRSETVLHDLSTLEESAFSAPKDLTATHSLISKIRAQVNRTLSQTLHEREVANAGYFDRLCTEPVRQREWEQLLTGKHPKRACVTAHFFAKNQRERVSISEHRTTPPYCDSVRQIWPT